MQTVHPGPTTDRYNSTESVFLVRIGDDKLYCKNFAKITLTPFHSNILHIKNVWTNNFLITLSTTPSATYLKRWAIVMRAPLRLHINYNLFKLELIAKNYFIRRCPKYKKYYLILTFYVPFLGPYSPFSQHVLCLP